MAKCTPQELERLTQLLTQGKVGETTVSDVLDRLPEGATPAEGEIRRKTGMFAPYRVMRFALGEEMGVRAIDPTIRQSTIVENTYNKYAKRYLDVFKENGLTGRFGEVSPENRKLVYKALELTDSKGRYLGKDQTFPPEVLATASQLRPIWNELFDKFGIDPDKFLQGYVPRRIKNPQGIFRNKQGDVVEEVFMNQLSQDEMRFYHELERKGTMSNYEEDAVSTFHSYLRGGLNTKVLKPFLDQVEQEVVNPYYNAQFIRNSGGQRQILVNGKIPYTMWQSYKHNLLGGVTEGDLVAAEQLRNIASYAGHEISEKDAVKSLYNMSHIFSSAWYAGAIGSPLGGRPASTIRHMFRLIPSFAEFGPKHMTVGLSKALDKENLMPLEEKGLLQSPIEKLNQQVDIASKAGRAISNTSNLFLKVFSGVDRIMRGSTALAAESKFNAAQAEGNLEGLSTRKAFREEFQRLIGQGKIDEARDRYMLESVNNLEYAFGPANKPQAFRGALGNVLSMFTTYPLNTFELYRTFGQRAVEFAKTKGESGDPMPLIRLVGVASAMIYAGKEYLNMDLTHSIFHGAFSVGMPAVSLASDTFQAGKSTVEHVIGDIYKTGETDYHKMKRKEAIHNMTRDLTAFVPGGVFFFNDVNKYVDGGTFKELMGFSPTSDTVNERTHEKAAAARAESRLE